MENASPIVVHKGDPGYERLISAWKSDKKDAGTLVIGNEQWHVAIGTDDNVFFTMVSGNIDSYYGSLSGGL